MQTPRLLTVIGTRPQYIKYAAMAAAGPLPFNETLIDTGQHFDSLLSDLFLHEYALRRPDITLNPGGQSGLRRLGSLMTQLDDVCSEARPDALLCFGDTDSTLAAGLTAAKLGIPLLHVEAGERSRDRDGNRIHPVSMTEEANRVTVDHLSTLLLCATRSACDNLEAEACSGEAVFTGDIMYDLFLKVRNTLPDRRSIETARPLPEGRYGLCTIHRAVNTDNPERLRTLLDTLNTLDFPVLLPLHPRTEERMQKAGITLPSGSIRLLPPLGHHDILSLLADADWLMTDSGGLTREAYFSSVPSLCLDEATAWYALTLSGWCTITGADPELIHAALRERPFDEADPAMFGDGNAAERVIDEIERYLR